MKFAAVGLLAFFLTTSALAGRDGFMPENTLDQEDSLWDGAFTETEFNAIIDSVMNVYVPEATKVGASLTVQRNWTSPVVNAYATESTPQNWMIAMFGGLARRPEVTADGFALVVCHELGHHFGGFPFYPSTDWAAAEGEADYWAVQACARRVWLTHTGDNAQARASVDPVAKQRCDASWSQPSEQDLCYRIAMGGLSLAKLLGALNGQANVAFGTPDESVVASTSAAHPKAQCRLDTYLNGALCRRGARPSFISGRGQPDGLYGSASEHEAAAQSCFKVDGLAGVRPACWFHEQLKLNDVGVRDLRSNWPSVMWNDRAY